MLKFNASTTKKMQENYCGTRYGFCRHPPANTIHKQFMKVKLLMYEISVIPSLDIIVGLAVHSYGEILYVSAFAKNKYRHSTHYTHSQTNTLHKHAHAAHKTHVHFI